jgi:hypothetical protein
LGSILSVTLFSIKINSLAKILNDNIEGSLYVDDFLICYRGKNMNNIGRQLQLCLNVLDTHFNILRALWLLFLSILIWGRKESLLSKRRPQNLVSEAILIGELYKVNSGSGWSPLLLQKCISRVFELENLNPG